MVTEYDIGGPISEDCLSLSIWTPAQGEGLPVIMFVTGGGFVTGGVEINYRKHIFIASYNVFLMSF